MIHALDCIVKKSKHVLRGWDLVLQLCAVTNDIPDCLKVLGNHNQWISVILMEVASIKSPDSPCL